MKKVLAIALLPTAGVLVILEQKLWARVLGVLFLALFLFIVWRGTNKGLSTVLWCLLVIAFVWATLWLYPDGVVNDTTIFLLAISVCVLSVWEYYFKKFRW